MSDGHTTECTFRKCAHPEAEMPCPFVKDEKPIEELPIDTGRFPEHLKLPPKHKHEWRQYWIKDDNTTTGDPVAYPDGFYCIHNPEHRKTY